MSSRLKFTSAILTIFVIACMLFFLGQAGVYLLSGLRAYVGGEGLWAKGQRDATYQLTQYIYTKEEIRYQSFLDALKVPLGDKTARIELIKPSPNDDTIFQGFVDGGNHPNDIPGMIFLFKKFKDLPYIRNAIEQWEIGDRLIAELIKTGELIHHYITSNSMSKEKADSSLLTIDKLQKKLNSAEDLFSYNMSIAARLTAKLMFFSMFIFTIVGSIICFIMFRMIAGIIIDLNDKNLKLITQAERERSVRDELKESEEKYRLLAENVTDIIWMTDMNFNPIYYSPSIYKLQGFSPEEAKARSIEEIMTPESYELAMQVFVQALDEIDKQKRDPDTPAILELELFCKDGSTIVAEVTANFILNSDGQLGGIIGVTRDITERKHYEKQVIASHREWEEIFHAIGHPTIILAPDHSIITANIAALKATGMSENQIKNKKCHDFFHNADKPPELCPMKALLKTGSLDTVEMEMEALNGTYLVSCTPIIDSDGRLVKIIHIATDITETKKLEDQLRQAQKMEAIGTLAGGIAHDFNNILSSIIGFTELAIDDVEKDSPIEDSLQEIYTGGKRARDLVKQILAFARQSDEVIKPIQIDTIAKEVLKLLRASIPTIIKINQNIEKNLTIMGNPTQVHQILMNICTNAAQEMEDDGGTLEISIKDVVINKKDTLDNLNPGEYAEIKISDTGAGIDPEVMDKIFDPYFTTKETGKGSGMGLALVHGIIKAYNGMIIADSEPGQGAVFKVYLPLIRSRRETDLYQPEILPAGDEKILLVDDETAIVKMSSQILQKLGYDVVYRTSSMKALELFRSDPNDFDLVITDMTMPDMTGDKLAIELMSIRRDIPVILCTGYSSKISDKTTAAIGIKAFAYKPVSKADLAKTVREVLDEAKG